MTALPNLPHYTHEDYQHWEGKWELWQGRAVAMSPAPTLPHAHFSRRLLQTIGNQLDANDACGSCDVFAEIDWQLADDLILRPDVAIVCRDLQATRIYHAPKVIVEILSPKTHLRDRNEKRDLYREHGVSRYFLAEPKDESLKEVGIEAQPATHRVDLHDGCSIELPSDWTR